MTDHAVRIKDASGDWLDLAYISGSGADAYYAHTQVAPSTSWLVVHNLGKRPSVMVVDSGESVIVPDISYIDDDQLTISFGSATSGKAYLN